MQTDITILGGLTVTIEFDINGPDEEVGIFGSEIDSGWTISHINGRKLKKPPQWLYDRITKKKGEEQKIYDQLNEYASSLEYEEYYDDN